MYNTYGSSYMTFWNKPNSKDKKISGCQRLGGEGGGSTYQKG